MAFFCCNFCIDVEERCLDEKLIGTRRERDYSFDVLIVIAIVDHVCNFLSARCAQGVLLEHSKRKRPIVADGNLAIVWLASPNRALGFVEPLPDWKLELF
jgi:hypothetical protein